MPQPYKLFTIYAREARFRIKELKRKGAVSLPLKRYAAIGGGALVLLLAIWLLPKMFQPRNSEGVTPSHPLNTAGRKSGFEMVQVQGGTFTMGSPANEEGRYDDECQHSVTVSSFSIGKYEVTQADWREIMGSDPRELRFKGCDDCPIESVSWNNIQDFLKKLNARYPGKNYRPPTEEEWEYAARGGTAGNNTYFSYSGSNDLNAVAWHIGNSGTKTHPVGGKTPNELGLYDMSGNVWEWCSDTYKSYPCDNKNTLESRNRVGRGGSWLADARGCRAANRVSGEAAYRFDYLGLRLVSVSLQ